MARTRRAGCSSLPTCDSRPCSPRLGWPSICVFLWAFTHRGERGSLATHPLYDVLLASGQNVPPLPPVPSLGRVVGRAWGSGLTAGRSLCLEHTPGYSLNSWIQPLNRLSSVTGIKVRFPGSVDRPRGLLAALCPPPFPEPPQGPASSLWR